MSTFPGNRVGELEATLIASGLVGRPPNEHSLPLVLDEDGRLYLHRYFDYEPKFVEFKRAALEDRITRMRAVIEQLEE